MASDCFSNRVPLPEQQLSKAGKTVPVGQIGAAANGPALSCGAISGLIVSLAPILPLVLLSPKGGVYCRARFSAIFARKSGP